MTFRQYTKGRSYSISKGVKTI